MYSAQIHKMAAAITGNTADGGRTSWATRPGTTIHGSAWTTGLGTTRHGSAEVGQVPRDSLSWKLTRVAMVTNKGNYRNKQGTKQTGSKQKQYEQKRLKSL